MQKSRMCQPLGIQDVCNWHFPREAREQNVYALSTGVRRVAQCKTVGQSLHAAGQGGGRAPRGHMGTALASS